MTLSEAIEQFEAGFAEVISDLKQQYDRAVHILWSGGLRTFDETSWALYATKDAAIVAWLEAAKSQPAGSKLKWIVRPELLEFQITIADRIGRHRAVNNRFAVKSQFMTEG